MKALELDISFNRDYFTHRFGIQYGRSYFEDVRSRAETDQAQKRALYQIFGDIGLGEPEPKPIVQLGYDDTLNISLMFGGTLQMGGNITWVEPGFLKSEDALKCPDIKNTWPNTLFLKQREEALSLFGSDSVLPPIPHGILEAALDLRGNAFLEELLIEPEQAEGVLDVLTETVIKFKEFWDIKCFGEIRKGLSLGGCSTTILNADLVAKFLVPRYSSIASHFGDAFLCSCGASTHNLENFAAIKGVRYLRLGWGTDLNKACQILRHYHIKADLGVTRIARLSPEEVQRDVTYILETLELVECLSILFIHAGAEVRDENIRSIVQTVVDFAETRHVLLKFQGCPWRY